MKTIDKSTITEKNLIEKIDALELKNAELELKIKFYEEQFRLQQQKLFGRSSEKSKQFEGQLDIFNEIEIEAKPEAPEPTFEEITYKRKKQKGHREEMLKDLPLEVIEYTLSDNELNCKCGGQLHPMKTEIRRELKIVPATVSVLEHHRHVYACRGCEKHGIVANIKKAKMPESVIPKSIASASSIAHVMTEKYVKAVPLYRQEQEWNRNGITLTRQTMSNWCVEASRRWLKLIYDRMHYQLLKKDILHADETTLQVLKEPGRNADSTSYIWLYQTGKYDIPIVLYEYQTTRARKHPEKFLTGFNGYLMTDGLESYSGIKGITTLGCWTHAKRYFSDAKKALPKKDENRTTLTVTEEGLSFFTELYKIEKLLRDVTPKERYNERLRQSKPILEKFKVWIKYYKPRVPPKLLLGKAINYCHNQWEKLERFLLDGRLEIDNNRAERAIKPFVIGRKNWLFSNTQNGATQSAIIYSIIETAKENQLIPFEYLKYLFDQLPNVENCDNEVLDNFMPWSNLLPEFCKSKIIKIKNEPC
jgi:transposase